MKSIAVNEEQLQKIKTAPGFVAALDQSGGSTPKALRLYGIQENTWSSDEEMFALVHQMRTRIITSPRFQRGADYRRHPVREHNGQGNRRATHRGLSLERETGRAVS